MKNENVPCESSIPSDHMFKQYLFVEMAFEWFWKEMFEISP